MTLVKALVLPPGFQLVLALAGLILFIRWRRTGFLLIVVAFVSLYALSIVPVSKALLMGLEVHPPLSDAVEAGTHQAIVVLGGGRYPDAPEYSGDTVNSGVLERLRYAAVLGNNTGLPILVSGGAREPERDPEAVLMNRVLEESFGILVDWMETHSRNTVENAEYSARLLKDVDIDRIFLVTHASHMPRAVWAFEREGMEVTPAPTAYASYKLDAQRLPWFIPSIDALNGSHRALYEYFAMWWYRLRY